MPSTTTSPVAAAAASTSGSAQGGGNGATSSATQTSSYTTSPPTYPYSLDLPAISLILQEIALVQTHLRRSSPRFSSQATGRAVSAVANLRQAQQQQAALHQQQQQQQAAQAQVQSQQSRKAVASSSNDKTTDNLSSTGTTPTTTASAAVAAAVTAGVDVDAATQAAVVGSTKAGAGHRRSASGVSVGGAGDGDVQQQGDGGNRRVSSASSTAEKSVDAAAMAGRNSLGGGRAGSLSAPAAASTSQQHQPPPRTTTNSNALGAAGANPGAAGLNSNVAAGGEAEEVEILAGFVVLKRQLGEVEHFAQLPPLSILRPFLAVVRSPLTSGPVTALALGSVHAFLQHLIPEYLPRNLQSDALSQAPHPSTPLQAALSATTSALARCKFPSASPAQDELVLLRLLKVAEALVEGPLESQLADEGVCEILEVGLGMGGRARLSEGLRKTAQQTVQAIVMAGFTRLKHMNPDEVFAATSEQIASPAAGSSAPLAIDGDAKSPDQTAAVPGDANASDSNATTEPRVGELPTEPPTQLYAPYGLPTLVELFRVLIGLLNPNDLTHTDSMRLSALTVLNTALEVGGKHIGRWDDLLDGLKDEGCRYLFQLIRSDNPQILILALRTTSTLFSTLLPHFKLQFELFLTFIIDRLTPATPTAVPAHLQHIRRVPSRRSTSSTGGGNAPSSPRSSVMNESSERAPTPRFNADLPAVASETRELMLETLMQLMRNRAFMVDLWVNFDCDLDSEDMFERLIEFLARGVYPQGHGPSAGQPLDGLDSSQTLCFEAILGFVNAMNERSEHGRDEWTADIPIERLMAQKARKAKLLTGVVAFNAKPRRGVAFLRENDLIERQQGDSDTLALAKFLKHTARLDKKVLGEYISGPDNVDLLKAFIGLFDFRQKSIADAMRDLLEAFRLPGEAQPIARITEVFAEHFFSFRPPQIANPDAAYVLAYSVIMLNTDQHNPQNRRRMTIEDYQKNLRGVNDGKDFAPEYLAAIHDSIRQREIIMPQEHVGQAGFDYAWKGLMIRSKAAGTTIQTNTTQFDKDIFTVAWRPVISAIASAFTTTSQDEYITQKAISGFRQCATMAGRFGLPDVIDTIVLSLSYATSLLDDAAEGESSSNFPVVERDGLSLVVSPLSIRFGTSFRSQLATIVLFNIANGNGHSIREGWSQIFEMFQTLFLHSLLPPTLSQSVDFLSGNSAIPLKVAKPQPREERRAESGLLSTLSSYLLSPYGSSTEALTPTSDEDVENTLSALDCIAACKVDELYEQIHSLPTEALVAALYSLRGLAESRCAPRGRDYMQSNGTRDDVSGRPLTPAYDEAQQPYDPGCVFDLELMISLATRAPETIVETWPIIFEFISSVLASAQSYSVLFIERAVVGLLKLCMLISDEPKLRDQLFVALDVLRSLPSSVLNAVSEQLMSGIARILEKDGNLVRSQTEWGLVIALFRATVAHPEASKVTLHLVQKMSAGTVGAGLSIDNFGGIVALLDEFATAAGAAASRQLVARKGTTGQPAATLGPTVERGLNALESIYEMRNSIAELVSASNLQGVDAWNAFWLPPLLVIGKHCVNVCKEIRQRAIGYLQRLLLSPQLISAGDEVIPPIFLRILFPVIDELLKPQVYERDPAGIEEMRLRSSTLLCKVFLQYLPRLATDQKAIVTVLQRVIDLLERFMRTAHKEQMLEAIPESLKNVVLVMHSSGLLQRPSSPDTRSEMEKAIWIAASERIERFLPGFMDDVIPAAPTPPAEGAAEPTKET